jgi:hypothetical protein
MWCPDCKEDTRVIYADRGDCCAVCFYCHEYYRDAYAVPDNAEMPGCEANEHSGDSLVETKNPDGE